MRERYARTVATTWQLAIEAATRITPVAPPMATLVAGFDPVGVPEQVLASGPACGFLTAHTPDRDTPVDVEAARKATRALHRLSLLTHEAGMVRMHNLTGRAVC